MASNLKKYIRTIPDFPHAGIQFRDITTLFNNSKGLRETVDQMADAMAIHNFDQVAGLEARGFMLGAALAYRLELGFTMIRKKGKLPGKTISQDYNLEYGEATLEIHDDAIEPGQKVLLFDDLIATGGTAEAGINLILYATTQNIAVNLFLNVSCGLFPLHTLDTLDEVFSTCSLG